jgi:hypothetical protein
MCVVCQIAITGAAAIAGVVPAARGTETISSPAATSQSASGSADPQALSPVSLGVDGTDTKGCVTPGQKVTAYGTGFDPASNNPKVFATPGLFDYGVYPETKESIAVDTTVTSSSRLTFVVPLASRFGKSSIAGLDLTFLFKWPGYFGDIALSVCTSRASGGSSQSGKQGSTGKSSTTTTAKSTSSGTSLIGKKCAPAGITLTVSGTKVICKKSGSTSRWVEAGK